jgi:L-alanine-DL-glutamate epimerase-like enolase superfamily enzyme
MRFGYGPPICRTAWENLKSVEAIREVIGYDTDLMLECYMGWNLEYAKRMLPKLARFEPRWLEERDRRRHRRLRRLNAMNIVPSLAASTSFALRLQAAAGQEGRLRRRDTNRVGGITAAHKINALCEAIPCP